MAWWRLVLGGAVVLGLMVAASLSADSPEWQGCVQWAAARERAWVDAAAEAPVPGGQARPGSSYEGYVVAARLAGVCRGADPEQLGDALDDAAAPSSAVRAALVALAPAVATLREAAHRSGGPGTWPAADLAPGAFTGVLDVLTVVSALRLEARLAAAAGDADGAVERLVDGLAAGVDLAHSLLVIEQLLGVLAADRCLASLDETVLAAASPARLRSLQGDLVAIDQALPPASTCLVDDVAMMVLALERHAGWSPADVGLNTSLAAWRHGFSVRRLGMDRARQVAEVARRFVRETPTAGESWPARRARLERAEREIDAVSRGLPFRPAGQMLAHEASRRETVARLRMLRIAVAWHLGEPLPDLADPFGEGPLQVVRSADGVTLASERASVRRTLWNRPR